MIDLGKIIKKDCTEINLNYGKNYTKNELKKNADTCKNSYICYWDNNNYVCNLDCTKICTLIEKLGHDIKNYNNPEISKNFGNYKKNELTIFRNELMRRKNFNNCKICNYYQDNRFFLFAIFLIIIWIVIGFVFGFATKTSATVFILNLFIYSIFILVNQNIIFKL